MIDIKIVILMKIKLIFKQGLLNHPYIYISSLTEKNIVTTKKDRSDTLKSQKIMNQTYPTINKKVTYLGNSLNSGIF